jgi:hypothetical protein
VEFIIGGTMREFKPPHSALPVPKHRSGRHRRRREPAQAVNRCVQPLETEPAF